MFNFKENVWLFVVKKSVQIHYVHVVAYCVFKMFSKFKSVISFANKLLQNAIYQEKFTRSGDKYSKGRKWCSKKKHWQFE